MIQTLVLEPVGEETTQSMLLLVNQSVLLKTNKLHEK